MLGPSLPQGSEAISYRNTLFRISELCWIKAVRLSVPEIVVRVLALLAGVAWFFAMESAKQTYVNVEFLLAGFPIALAWSTAGTQTTATDAECNFHPPLRCVSVPLRPPLGRTYTDSAGLHAYLPP